MFLVRVGLCRPLRCGNSVEAVQDNLTCRSKNNRHLNYLRLLPVNLYFVPIGFPKWRDHHQRPSPIPCRNRGRAKDTHRTTVQHTFPFALLSPALRLPASIECGASRRSVCQVEHRPLIVLIFTYDAKFPIYVLMRMVPVKL